MTDYLVRLYVKPCQSNGLHYNEQSHLIIEYNFLAYIFPRKSTIRHGIFTDAYIDYRAHHQDAKDSMEK